MLCVLRKKKIAISMGFAFFVAVTLLIIAFYFVFTNNKNENFDIFKCSSYYAKYKMKVYSNKNENEYEIEEFFKSDEKGERLKFNILNDDRKFYYMLKNNEVTIKSNVQKSSLELKQFENCNVNLFSFLTFVKMYNSVVEKNDKNVFNVIKKEVDNELIYTVKFNNVSLDESSEFYYLKELNDKNYLSKFELKINKELNTVICYTIYKNESEIFIQINYEDFKLNEHFSEKVFDF